MIVLHANWLGEKLHIWGEMAQSAESGSKPSGTHPFAASSELLADIVREVSGRLGAPGTLSLRLPSGADGPAPSPHCAHHRATAIDTVEQSKSIRAWSVPTVSFTAREAPLILDALEETSYEMESHLIDEASGHEAYRGPHLHVADSIRYFAACVRLARSLLAGQRFVPVLASDDPSRVVAGWRAWMADDAIADPVETLVASMPPAIRAASENGAASPVAIVDSFMAAIVDSFSRDVLQREDMADAIRSWDQGEDPHVRWLQGLLDGSSEIEAPRQSQNLMYRDVRRWLGQLEERARHGSWRLCLRLTEPADLSSLADLEAPSDDISWELSFGLQLVENDRLIVEAEDIWSMHAESATVAGVNIEQPQDLLLAELGRASRIFPRLESAMDDPSPVAMDLTTPQAYEFLREIKPLMIEQGIGVIAPEWWDSPRVRIGTRLKLDSAELAPHAPETGSSPGSVAPATLGLEALVSYEWKIAIGDTPLSFAEFQRLVAQRAPLVRVGGQWVEVRQEDVRAALRFINEHPGGAVSVGEAMRMAYGWESTKLGVPILGVDAHGWVKTLIEASGSEDVKMPQIEEPEAFRGSLRPYQKRGISWLAFLDRFGLGPCLADDMGLGKTIQLLALLLHERARAASGLGEPPGPTLLVVPMSIVANWHREAHRFAPDLRVQIHHGSERRTGESFFDAAARSDLVITTYALAHRDRETLERVGWHRVVLDEAQNIKNASAKQTQAIRALDAPRRVALTGTPLENRLTELWSIMEFCNPGYLGTIHEFKREFAIPIERHRDRQCALRLRQLVRPFILRRLKTDPNVITDLPEKVETKEFCRLTSEQVELYESLVSQMLTEVDQSDGIRRRGIVLTALTRLKQICDHPALLDGPVENGKTSPAAATRSGKCIRLLEMLDEVIASGEQALVFTQFRQMGALLLPILRHSLDRDILFLHGGTPAGQRQVMIDQFQKSDGTSPVFLLSLKAGGVGLNLTAASHVFHFDRWWNPAVENQATDRAYRIGQSRRVQVHKFVVSGTLEERIDQMIESKIALAEDVIGSGEEWLTEMSTSQLRELLTLRPDAMADE